MITNTEIARTGNQFPNHIVDFKQENDKLYFTTQNGVILQVTILRDSVVRFRYATEHVFEPDFSYAISEDVNLGYNELTVEDEIPEYVITTAKIKIYINKTNLKVQIVDLDGVILAEDELGFHWEENFDYGGNVVKMSKICHAGESYYGMGDKASHTQLEG